VYRRMQYVSVMLDQKGSSLMGGPREQGNIGGTTTFMHHISVYLKYNYHYFDSYLAGLVQSVDEDEVECVCVCGEECI
jgi:hypothetical protein